MKNNQTTTEAKIDAIVGTTVIDFKRYGTLEAWKKEKIMQLLAQEKKAVLDNAIAEIENWMWLQEDIEEAVELGQGEVAGQRIAMNNSLNRVCQFLAHSQEDREGKEE